MPNLVHLLSYKMVKLPLRDSPVNIRQPRLSLCLQAIVLLLSIVMILFVWTLIETLQSPDSSDLFAESGEALPAIDFYPLDDTQRSHEQASYDSSAQVLPGRVGRPSFAFRSAGSLMKNVSNAAYSSTGAPQLSRFVTPRHVLAKLRRPLLAPERSPTVCPPSTLQMIYVISAARNLAQRVAIRQTWAAAFRSTGHAGLVFVVGIARETRVNQAVRIEHQLYDDVLLLNVAEQYELLTQKTLGSFAHALDNCAHVPYLLKCDDDMLVNVPLLDAWLVQDWIGSQLTSPPNSSRLTNRPVSLKVDVNDRASSGIVETSGHSKPVGQADESVSNDKLTSVTSGLNDKTSISDQYLPGDGFICHLLPNTRPIRSPNNKWYLPEWVYPASHYPPYCNGPFYMLRNSSLPALMAAAEHRDLLFLEDVHFTGLVRVDAGRPPIRHLPQLINFAKLNECAVRQRFTTHAIKEPSSMRRLWRLMLTDSSC
jgi:hypothetical protein